MDSLDLPEMEHDYSDLPDASEGLEAPEQHTAPVLAAEDDLSDIEMPVLSEMDGSAPVQPVKAEAPKQAAPVQISEMGAASSGSASANSSGIGSVNSTASMSGISEMGAPSYSTPKKSVQPAAPASGGYTPVSGGNTAQNNGAASYSSVYSNNNNASVQRTNDFFADAERIKAEKYENGHGKAKVLGIISIVLGALTILGHLEVSVTGLLGIVLGVLIIYHALKFMKQSERSRRILGWLYVWDLIDGIRSMIYLSNIALTLTDIDIVDVSAYVSAAKFIIILGIIFNGIMTYFFMFNPAVHDYTIDDSR